MADVQKEMVAFDEKIRLKKFEENKELRDKRDIILTRLRDSKTLPSFEDFNQGSYAMGTGIIPADGDYDIDVGLKFNVKKADFPNPVSLKEKVASALVGHTELGTTIRRSCVTVAYKKDGEQAFHVDLAVYAWDDPESKSRRLFISKGKVGSADAERKWEESEPQKLVELVGEKFKADEQQQFLRLIRLMKRWKTERFALEGNAAPTGISLTAMALESLIPVVVHDGVSNKNSPDDRKALRAFVDRSIPKFSKVGQRADGSALYRLKVTLPVIPGNDLFSKMTDEQMTNFRDRLVELRAVLDSVEIEVDPVAACTMLQKQFGSEFPVPSKDETGARKGRAVVSGGVSA
ncbi:MAG: nucleotidyltransferase [Archangium sp.]